MCSTQGRCASSARALSSQAAGHHPDGPDPLSSRGVLRRSTPRGGLSACCVVNLLSTPPQHGMRKDLLAPQAAPSLSAFAVRRGGLPALV